MALAMLGRRPCCSAKTVFLFTFLLTFDFSFYTHNVCTDHLRQSTLLDIGNRFTNLVQDTLSPNPNPLWPLEILRNAEEGEQKTTGDGTRNTVEIVLGFVTDEEKGSPSSFTEHSARLMSNPWRIRWMILEPG